MRVLQKNLHNGHC